MKNVSELINAIVYKKICGSFFKKNLLAILFSHTYFSLEMTVQRVVFDKFLMHNSKNRIIKVD